MPRARPGQKSDALPLGEGLGVREDCSRCSRDAGEIGEVRACVVSSEGHPRALQDLPCAQHPWHGSSVAPTELERTAIARLVEAAGERLTGDWVLVGGALAALWFSPERATEDVDLVAVVDEQGKRYEVVELALAQGLPLEAVNSAADFFLRRIPGWQEELEVLHAGPRARILRPSPTLFLLLKIGRMSEADLGDCLGLIALVERCGLPLDGARVEAGIDALKGARPSPAAERCETPRSHLSRA